MDKLIDLQRGSEIVGHYKKPYNQMFTFCTDLKFSLLEIES